MLFNDLAEIIFAALTIPVSRLAFSHESLACAALTMMVEPNSRRMERAVPWTDRSVPAHRGFW